MDMKCEFKVKEEPLEGEQHSEADDQIFVMTGLQEVDDHVIEEDYIENDSTLTGEGSSGSGYHEVTKEETTTDKHDRERFICSYCNCIFESKDDLMIHLEWFSDGKCSQSSSEFINSESDLNTSLLNHRNTFQSTAKTKLFKCSECSYECKQKSNLKQHMLIHQNIKLFKCSECSYESNRKWCLKVHMQTHKDKSGSGYQEVTKEETTTDKHKGEKHSCSYCNCIFESKDDLTIHLEWFSNGKCSQSSSEFINCESDLNTYLLNLRNTFQSTSKAQLFKCSQCNYECKQKSNLKQHTLIHQNTKLFKCSECSYESNRKWCLKVHMLTHKDKKLYKCSECDYECNRTGRLKEHFYMHRNNKFFKCSECSYECKQKETLKSHLLTHTNIKFFKCPKCDYETNRKYSLKLHMLTHEDKKLFKCSECNYETNRTTRLKEHIITHQNIKLFNARMNLQM